MEPDVPWHEMFHVFLKNERNKENKNNEDEGNEEAEGNASCSMQASTLLLGQTKLEDIERILKAGRP